MISRSIEKARQAYEDKDIEMLKTSHRETTYVNNSKHKEGHKNVGDFLKSAVYGGLDGIITTFAVVMGSAGANLNVGVIVILGLANMIGDGISMALGDYISSRSERQFNLREKAREEWEVENNPEGEIHEMVEIYMSRGMTEEDSLIMANTLSKNKKAWVDIMMLEELGIVIQEEESLKGPVITFFSFVFFGIIPILPFIFALAASTSNINDIFFVSIALTGVSLFLLGAIKSIFTGQGLIKAGMETLFIGALASGFAYAVGIVFEPLANQ